MSILIRLLFIILLPSVAFAEMSDDYLNEILSRHVISGKRLRKYTCGY